MLCILIITLGTAYVKKKKLDGIVLLLRAFFNVLYTYNIDVPNIS